MVDKVTENKAAEAEAGRKAAEARADVASRETPMPTPAAPGVANVTPKVTVNTDGRRRARQNDAPADAVQTNAAGDAVSPSGDVLSASTLLEMEAGRRSIRKYKDTGEDPRVTDTLSEIDAKADEIKAKADANNPSTSGRDRE